MITLLFTLIGNLCLALIFVLAHIVRLERAVLALAGLGKATANDLTQHGKHLRAHRQVLEELAQAHGQVQE